MFGNCEVETHKIYRVIERNSDERSKQNNKLLFHGTNIDSGLGILEEGFKPSSRGKFGSGVYLTASSRCAVKYSVSKTCEHYGINKSKTLPPDVLLNIIVSEVLESNKLKLEVIECKKNKGCKPRTHQFEKYIVKGTAEADLDDTYEEDSNERQIRTSREKQQDYWNHYVCHENFVIPRYLIDFNFKK